MHELGSVGVSVTIGIGFMDIEKFSGILVHPFNVAVAEIVPVITPAVVFVPKLKGEICPFPEAVRPIPAFELVHAKVAPLGMLTKSAGSADELGHPLTLLIGLIVGVGRIVIENEALNPLQPFRVGVTETVPTKLVLEVFAGAL